VNSFLLGARAKVAHAKQQFERLEPTVAAALATSDGQNTIRVEQIAERRFKALAAIAPLPVEIPLVIGDIVHNLRASLDHLGYDLAVKNGTDERRATNTQFPCSASASRSTTAGKAMTGSVSVA
jgi:hypothetical protein